MLCEKPKLYVELRKVIVRMVWRRKCQNKRIRAMKKPVPEQFGFTVKQYEQAIAQLAHIRAQEERTKSIRTFFKFMACTAALVVAIGVAIAVVKLTIWFLVNEFNMEEDYAIGITSLLGFVVWCFVAAAVSGALEWILDKYYDCKLSKELSMPIYSKVQSYENALNQYHRRIEGYWKSLKGMKLEKALARLYKEMGYSVRQTKGSGDEGIDLILSKEGKTTVVQCKGHKKPIGVGAIRDLYGTMMHEGTESAVLACPAGFTKAVRKFATGKPIRLISATDLVEMSESIDQEND